MLSGPSSTAAPGDSKISVSVFASACRTPRSGRGPRCRRSSTRSRCAVAIPGPFETAEARAALIEALRVDALPVRRPRLMRAIRIGDVEPDDRIRHAHRLSRARVELRTASTPSICSLPPAARLPALIRAGSGRSPSCPRVFGLVDDARVADRPRGLRARSGPSPRAVPPSRAARARHVEDVAVRPREVVGGGAARRAPLHTSATSPRASGRRRSCAPCRSGSRTPARPGRAACRTRWSCSRRPRPGRRSRRARTYSGPGRVRGCGSGARSCASCGTPPCRHARRASACRLPADHPSNRSEM